MQKPLVHFVRIYFLAPMFDDLYANVFLFIGFEGAKDRHAVIHICPKFDLFDSSRIRNTFDSDHSSPMLHTYIVKIRFDFKKVR